MPDYIVDSLFRCRAKPEAVRLLRRGLETWLRNHAALDHLRILRFPNLISGIFAEVRDVGSGRVALISWAGLDGDPGNARELKAIRKMILKNPPAVGSAAQSQSVIGLASKECTGTSQVVTRYWRHMW